MTALGGRRVVSFESRRAVEMASLLARYGATPVIAPSMREIPHAENEPARAFARALRAGGLDALVLMTGVGTRALVAATSGEFSAAELCEALSRIPVVARGPKPAAVLRELGVSGFRVAPEPNTWREVLVALGELSRGKKIGVQEHGVPSEELYRALESEGHTVCALSVYRWALPEDTAPLRAALHELARGDARVALFTSQNQVANVLRVAAEEGIASELRAGLAAGVVASIGPVCSEALVAEGLPPDIEPEHSKMGHLVKAVAARAPDLLQGR